MQATARTYLIAIAAALSLIVAGVAVSTISQAVAETSSSVHVQARKTVKVQKTKQRTAKQRKADRKACNKLTKRQRKNLRKTLKRSYLTKAQCNKQIRKMRVILQNPSSPAGNHGYANPAVFGLSANTEADFSATESALGIKAGVVGVFTDFTQPFPTYQADRAKARGAELMISWEPQVAGGPQIQPAYSLSTIIAGNYDSYIAQFARDAAATGRPVFVRWAAEMNGDWQVWATGFNGNGPGDYINAYRHVVNVARAAGGSNIKWIFNPIVSYVGSTSLRQLYPGDAYVDWVALDGYNWGSVKPWGWQSFTDVYSMGLAELRSVAPNKPLAIAEIGSAPGARKAAWVTDTFAKARAAGVRMMVWFDHNKETDWRLTSDPATAKAAKAAIKDNNWTTGGNQHTTDAALDLQSVRFSRRSEVPPHAPQPSHQQP